MSGKTILVIEDEKDINDLIALQLSREGYTIDQAYDGQSGLSKLANRTYDIVILDWMLPGTSGIEILKKIRHGEAGHETAVIMTTAKGMPEDVVYGLEHGADDYLAKPFDLNVLKARIRAVLRRSPMVSSSSEHVLTVGDLVVNLREHKATSAGQKMDLTVSEFKLLSALMINVGKVMSRKELISEIQGEGVVVIDRSIDTHMLR